MTTESPAPLVAVTGGFGRLGTAIVQRLVDDGLRVRALDMVEGVHVAGVDNRFLDLMDPMSLDVVLDGVKVLVHLAGLHGAHLAAGTSRHEVWRVNVEGTWRLLRAARHVERVVFASSTSVYGSGSPSGPARVLDEDTALAPADVYDLSKVIGERMLDRLREEGQQTVGLRLGRFFYGSRGDYHLRKLSTGLDLADATTAVAAVVRAETPLRPSYCVVSDLDLTDDQRRRLGTDLPAVLEEAVPGLADKVRRIGYPLPARYGKSAASRALRADTGWAPARDLRWWSGILDDELPAGVGANGSARGTPDRHRRNRRVGPGCT